LDAPVLGAQDVSGDHEWIVGVSWRYQKSDRHFRGSEEETNRQAEHSEVINRVHQPELTITRRFGPRWSLTFGLPYLMATRSSPIRGAGGVVIGRSETHANGIGDVTFVARRWMFAPKAERDYGLALGWGVKLPTGASSVQDARTRFNTTTSQFVTTVETVDQSIQPGDGGFGIVLDLSGFYRFAGDHAAAYLTGVYLANPEDTSGVATFRGDPGEEVMSIADQYLARAGAAWFPTEKISASAGIRYEGVAVHDLIGDSDGFRRPGYAASIEPGFSYSFGKNTFQVLTPIAVHRNRKKNVPDLRNNDHGDAAFADWVLLTGWTRRF
jgi:hypothetical protein